MANHPARQRTTGDIFNFTSNSTTRIIIIHETKMKISCIAEFNDNYAAILMNVWNDGNVGKRRD